MCVFSLNGLDEFLQLEEKKWSQEMLLNTAIVTAIGISQIAIGTAIELYSVGIMSQVGIAFINEGVNDLFFAVGALKSGHFSWEDYKQHKIESLMLTAMTFGIGAFLSRGTKVSRFGHKLAGPGLEVGGEKVSEICGNQLIQTVGGKVVAKEVSKRMSMKAMEGVAFGLANAAIDTLVEDYLQRLCNDIAPYIFQDIEKVIQNHTISASLKELYETLGEDKAKQIMKDLAQSTFTEHNCVLKFLPIAKKIVGSVKQGIVESVIQGSTSKGSLIPTFLTTCNVLVWLERVAHTAYISKVTGRLLNELDRKIRNISISNEIIQNAEQNKNQGQGKEYENFKKELIDQWKSLLCEKAGRVITQHIVSPILKDGTNYLMRYCGEQMQKVYQSLKENLYLEQFEELKHEYHRELPYEQQCDDTSKMGNHITIKYHEGLRKLMKKTRNPDLLADIVRENIPMDMTCANACTEVVYSVLKEQGIAISGLTVIVKGDGGIRQEFSSMSDGPERVIIPLELKDNDFEFCASTTSERNISKDSKNVLYEALSGAIPDLKDVMPPEKFRAEVANCIERDPKIRHHIQQGWNRLPVALGGASTRKHLKRARDLESPSFDKGGLLRYREFQYRENNICDSFLRLGGTMQMINEQTNVNRIELAKSQFQKQRNERSYVPAAHVVGTGEINLKIAMQSEQLVHFLNLERNSPKCGNEWQVVKFQSNNLKKLEYLNFKGSLTAEDACIMKTEFKDKIWSEKSELIMFKKS